MEEINEPKEEIIQGYKIIKSIGKLYQLIFRAREIRHSIQVSRSKW